MTDILSAHHPLLSLSFSIREFHLHFKETLSWVGFSEKLLASDDQVIQEEVCKQQQAMQ